VARISHNHQKAAAPLGPPPDVHKLSCTVVGSLNRDTIASVDHLPSAGETVAAAHTRRGAGGKGLNQAIMASRLGARVRMIGRIGDDADGRDLAETLAAENVDVSRLQVATGLPTGTAFVCVASDGENHIILNSGANACLEPDLAAADANVLIAQLETPAEVAETMIAAARGFVCLNVAPAKPVSLQTLMRCDLIVANESEWAQMPELEHARRVVVTLGSAGCALIEEGQETMRVPAPQVLSVDTVGAGDAFVVTVALSIATGLPIESALIWGCRAGALATTRTGAAAALPTRSELAEAV
jgi:ribokinase